MKLKKISKNMQIKDTERYFYAKESYKYKNMKNG